MRELESGQGGWQKASDEPLTNVWLSLWLLFPVIHTRFSNSVFLPCMVCFHWLWLGYNISFGHNFVACRCGLNCRSGGPKAVDNWLMPKKVFTPASLQGSRFRSPQKVGCEQLGGRIFYGGWVALVLESYRLMNNLSRSFYFPAKGWEGNIFVSPEVEIWTHISSEHIFRPVKRLAVRMWVQIRNSGQENPYLYTWINMVWFRNFSWTSTNFSRNLIQSIGVVGPTFITHAIYGYQTKAMPVYISLVFNFRSFFLSLIDKNGCSLPTAE